MPSRREGRPPSTGHCFEIQDAGSAEPSRSVAGGDGAYGARPFELASLLRPQAASHGRPTPARTAKDNGRKLKDRAKVEHVHAHQKVRMGLTIRIVRLARAKAAITMANIAYNMGRLRWSPGRAKTDCAQWLGVYLRPASDRRSRNRSESDVRNPGQIQPHPILIDP